LLGQYEEAWKEYEWRWKHFSPFARIRDRYPLEKYWKGQNCKRVLLYPEQGVGDSLMCIRYAKEINATTMLECSEDIIPLFKDFVDEIYVFGKAPSNFDYHCSLVGLPEIFGANLNNICGDAYLSGSLSASSDWDKYKGLKIGICWAGNPIHPNDENRSCPLKFFEDIGKIPEVILFSLQKEHLIRKNGANLNAGAEVELIDMSEFMNDWNKTASIIANMDLIVTVDTALAHLSGGMGKPTWILLPNNSDWRWGKFGETTPWYSSVRLFRQKEKGNWKSVFKSLLNEIKNLI
jgi:hypothetical protein